MVTPAAAILARSSSMVSSVIFGGAGMASSWLDTAPTIHQGPSPLDPDLSRASALWKVVADRQTVSVVEIERRFSTGIDRDAQTPERRAGDGVRELVDAR